MSSYEIHQKNILTGVVALAALSAWTTTANSAKQVSLAIPGNAPFTGLKGGEISGVIAQVSELALSQLGYQVAPAKIIFPKMYSRVHRGKVDVATSVFATPKRRGLAHYSAPVIVEYNVIMVPKGKAFKFEKMSDLNGLRLAGRFGFRYPPIDKAGIKLLRAKTHKKNVKRIASGQLDGAIIGSITGAYIAKALGVESKVEFLSYAINPVPLGAALNMKKFSTDDLKAFNAAVAKIRAGGDWARILKENGIEKLVREWPILPELKG